MNRTIKRIAVQLMKKVTFMSISLIIAFPLYLQAEDTNLKKKNILFIAIDDLNDWIGPMGGNDQVKTPNLDAFAKMAVVFNRAYSPATVCGPSRSAILTGKQCSNTGLYGNKNNLKEAPLTKDLETLPEYFGNRGYHTLSRGKIFHKHATSEGVDEGQWAYKEWSRSKSSNHGMKWIKEPKVDGVKSGGSPFTWGATEGKKEDLKDYLTCKWGSEQLARDFDNKPFFMAIGISKPHLPFYAPQEYFDMYPLDKVKAAPFKRDDLDDIVDSRGRKLFKQHDRFILADKNNLHREANQAYMACISYIDDCVGLLLDTLEKSKHAENTIVVIWGDHGWHLGEKLKYGKTGLWEESARVPLIIRAPGYSPDGVKTNGVVNLLDLYPTLIDLCGLEKNKQNDGKSFAPLLKEPKQKWDNVTLTTHKFKNHSLTDGRFRYIHNFTRKGDVVEELYDHQKDPLEHTNIANNPEHAPVIAEFKKHLPEHNEPEIAKSTVDKKLAKSKLRQQRKEQRKKERKANKRDKS